MATVPIYPPDGFGMAIPAESVIVGDRIIVKVQGHDRLVTVTQVSRDVVVEISWRSRETDGDGIPCMSGAIRVSPKRSIRLADRPSAAELAAERAAGVLE